MGGFVMTRFSRVAMLVALAGAVIVAAAGAAPTDPPFPLRINLPTAPAQFPAEGIAMQGKTFWLPATGTGAVIKGDVETGVITPAPPAEFIPASPATPSLSHRTA